MKTTDIYKVKGQIKSAAQAWSNGKIDVLLAGDKSATRAMLKNVVNNIIARHDEDINAAIDAVALCVSDEAGEIDTDTLVDRVADIFAEFEPFDITLAGFRITGGKGRAEVILPDTMLMKLIAGNIGGVAISTDDIRELKQFINA